MNTQKAVAIQRQKVLKNLLPDKCSIQPATGTGVVIDEGIVTETTASLRVWHGQTDIPCRFDIDRAFRPDKFKTQATIVDEYTLELPSDIVVEASDTINHRGRVYILRKIKDASEWDVTIECTVVEIGTDIDYSQSS